MKRSEIWTVAGKITTVGRSKLQQRVGMLADEDMLRVNRAVLVFLGLAGRPENAAFATLPSCA